METGEVKLRIEYFLLMLRDKSGIPFNPEEEIIKCLVKDAEEEGVKNIEVIDKSWQEISDSDISKEFDIIACSHLLWQFKDVDEQLKRMEDASRKDCCAVHPAGSRSKEMRRKASQIRNCAEIEP